MTGVTTIIDMGTHSSDVDAEVVEARHEHELEDVNIIKEKMYYGIIFLFHPLQGRLGSTFVILLVLISLVAQTFFIYLVNVGFSETQFDETEQQAFRSWRLNVAHDMGRLDILSETSLASRVCDVEAHGSLDTSTKQALYVADLLEYLANDLGCYFCLVTMFCWCAFIVEEIKHAVGFLSATFALQWGRKPRVVVQDDEFVLESFLKAH